MDEIRDLVNEIIKDAEVRHRNNGAEYWRTLQKIKEVVHTPTSKTRHRSAYDHFHSDFEYIRKIIAKTS